MEKNLTTVVEGFLKVQNLGIDYTSFKDGYELADYLNGRRFPGFDEPFIITNYEREGLQEIYKEFKKEG